MKKIEKSSLSENTIKYAQSPIDYIMKAINSNDFSFYELKKDLRLQEIFENISLFIGNDFSNELFVLRLYTTIYFKFIYSYMLNGLISDQCNICFQHFQGFSKSQLDSWICCLQNAIKNQRNVKNGTKVFRGTKQKFPDIINIGSKFYFQSFISTSKNYKFAEWFLRQNEKGTMMTIDIEYNGTDDNHPNYCFNLKDISLTPEQEEILICSHCYYQVISIKRSETIDYVELVCLGYLLNNFN